MKFLNLLSISIGFWLLISPLSANAFEDDTLGIGLNARVAAQCGLGDVIATPTSNGVVVRVSTACNLETYSLVFSGASNLRLSAVDSGQNVVGSLSAGSNAVRVRAQRPGAHSMELSFDNSAEELSNLTVSLGSF